MKKRLNCNSSNSKLSCKLHIKRIARITQVLTVLIMAGILHVSAATYAQEQRISVRIENGTFYDVVTQIEKQSEFMFFYKSEDIDNNQRITLEARNKLVSDILNELLKGRGMSYQIMDKHIIITKNNTSSAAAPQQQMRTISGVVTDAAREPLVGVNVIVKGTTNGSITDIDGKFTITQVPPGAILQISYIGYASQEIQAGNASNLNITLLEDSKALEEVVVTGYSTQKKRDLTGSVAVVKLDEVESIVSSNVMQTLQGRVPGVFITSTGNPNGDATVLIRGVSTLGTSSNQAQRSTPLYIIDGVPTQANMSTLSSQDIESIQVLKDASSATIYGSRASNGVIIITTKKADRQTTSIRLRSSMSVRQYTEKPLNWLNTYERGWVQWRAARNDGTDPANNGWPYSFVDHQDANGNWVLDEIQYPEFLDATTQTMRPADTDWVNEILQTSVTQNYNVTVSTGGNKGRALLALDYLDNVGSVKGTYNNRMSLRINSDYSVIENRLTIGENISLSKTKRSRLNASSLLNSTRQIQPIVPIHTVNGVDWGGATGAMDDNGKNPLRIIEWNEDNYDNIMRLFGDVHLDLEIIRNLHYRTTLGLDQNFTWRRVMTRPFRDGGQSDPTSRVESTLNRQGTLIWNNTLNYSFNLNNHAFDVLVGHEQTDMTQDYQSYMRDGYDSLDKDYMYIFTGTSGITLNSSGGTNSATQYRLLSYFGKANYNYNNKYLASFTLRHDGSSRFGANNRFATFPAFSLGWRISEEDFFKSAVPFVSDLKLRYGWGMTGNQNIDDFASYGLYEARYTSDWTGRTTYDMSTAYDITGQGTGIAPMGFRRTQLANSNLKWEASTQNNGGIDFGLFDQKLTGSADYFFIKTTNILVTPPSLAVLGEGANRSVNGASMENRGFEFLLSYNDKISDLRYTVTANLSAYSNKVTSLPNEVITQYPGNGVDKTILGRPRSVVFGYVTDGIFKSQDEVDAHVTQAGKGVGRLRYLDIAGPNGSGPDGLISDADRDFIGKTDPDFTYGLNITLQYKQWDMNVFFNGVQGSYANVGSTKRNEQFIGASEAAGQNYGKSTLETWTYENSNSNIPALSLRDVNSEKSRMSTYFLENTSYFKLRNVEIGYTIPKHITSKALIQNARVYFIGENLFKIYKKSGDNAFTGADPETPGTAYPIPLSMTVGLNVTF
ncbi:MAG: TonB-dependent receptor [Tannerellaceae bacterium]|nr:TonB-dependent receptor [Tannerellaceae bacterium]